MSTYSNISLTCLFASPMVFTASEALRVETHLAVVVLCPPNIREYESTVKES